MTEKAQEKGEIERCRKEIEGSQGKREKQNKNKENVQLGPQ